MEKFFNGIYNKETAIENYKNLEKQYADQDKSFDVIEDRIFSEGEASSDYFKRLYFTEGNPLMVRGVAASSNSEEILLVSVQQALPKDQIQWIRSENTDDIFRSSLGDALEFQGFNVSNLPNPIAQNRVISHLIALKISDEKFSHLGDLLVEANEMDRTLSMSEKMISLMENALTFDEFAGSDGFIYFKENHKPNKEISTGHQPKVRGNVSRNEDIKVEDLITQNGKLVFVHTEFRLRPAGTSIDRIAKGCTAIQSDGTTPSRDQFSEYVNISRIDMGSFPQSEVSNEQLLGLMN